LHRGVQETLLGHKASITALKYLKQDSSFLLTGDSNGVLKLWQDRQGVSWFVFGANELISQQWSCIATCQAHEGSLSCLDLLRQPCKPEELLLISAGSDSTLKTWRFSSEATHSLELVQSISLKGKLPLALSATALLDPEGVY
jgi:WD40 repeat protein